MIVSRGFDVHHCFGTVSSGMYLMRRCPPIMDIVLHMLNGYLLASKAYLNCHLKETAEFDRQSQTVSSLSVPGQAESPEVTREELKNALLAAQVSPTSFNQT